ncbi:MAG: hypothetical protein HQL63_15590 [Magnetococcales bacterium]|nr:hypothetical protein [Magnetococcales bacterium]MBF0322637.1 hypothetical protein [Magnetococcales bacterium]
MSDDAAVPKINKVPSGTYAETLPPDCPPSDAVKPSERFAYRLLMELPAKREDFDSHAKLEKKAPSPGNRWYGKCSVMGSQSSSSNAITGKTLLYFDGPQIIHLNETNESGTSVIAVAVDYDDSEMEQPFFACYICKDDWERYAEGKKDLYYLFSNALQGECYFFDLRAQHNEVVQSRLASNEEVENSDFWPDKGFLFSGHSEDMDEFCGIFKPRIDLGANIIWEEMVYSF